MVSRSKLLVSCIILMSCIFFSFCNEDSPRSGESRTRKLKSDKQDVNRLPIKNRAVLFIDKTSSMISVSQEDAKQSVTWLLDTLLPKVHDSGIELSIYFIQKDLVSASPFYRVKIAVPNTDGMITIRRLKAMESFNKECDSLKTVILNAITVGQIKGTDKESDLFATLKKADDFLSRYPDSDIKMIFYYSDMIESVLDKTCGRNYQKKYFQKVDEAITAGKNDAEPIRRCQSVEKLPKNTSVYLIIPNGALDLNKHKYIPDYWKALFKEFGVKKVENNL